MEKQIEKLPPGVLHKTGIGISPRIYVEPDRGSEGISEDKYEKVLLASQFRLQDINLDELSFDTFSPHFISPAPPIFPLSQAEVVPAFW